MVRFGLSMPKEKDKPEMEHLSSIRVQKVVVDYIRQQMKESKFNSISHGIERLSYLGMEVEKEQARVVHQWKGVIKLKKPVEEEKKK